MTPRTEDKFLKLPIPDEDVLLLNMLQKSHRVHPYTCGGGGGPCSGVDMVATNKGMLCPNCGRIQTAVWKMSLSLARLLDAEDWPNWNGKPQRSIIMERLKEQP